MAKNTVQNKEEKTGEKRDLGKDLENKLKVEEAFTKAFTKLDEGIFDVLNFSRKYGGW